MIRNVNWRTEFIAKEQLMIDRGYEEIKPMEFYRDLFPKGSLQTELNDGKANIIASQLRPSGEGKTKQWVVTDDLEKLDKVIGDEFGLVPPLSFYGKSHTERNAHELYAMVIDVDYVGVQQLKNQLKQFGNGIQLRPTYLVNSGKGLHLYYFLKEPQPIYRNLKETLSKLKEDFIDRLWNDTSSLKPDEPDSSNIYQGFRCVGSQTKLGSEYITKAYKLSDNRYTLEDIKNSIPSCKVDLSVLYEKPKKIRKTSLEKAKELYPNWYEERVVKGIPNQNGKWVCNEALYEWWKRQITENVKSGGRYFSIMALCAYGLKCGISEHKIRRDAYAFVEHLENLTEDEDNHFTRADVKDALKCLKGNKRELTNIASREWLSKKTKVDIPKNKRRPQGRTLSRKRQMLRAIEERDILYPNGEWREGNGRKSKEQVVKDYLKEHPTARKVDVIRETGLSKTTVYKYMK